MSFKCQICQKSPRRGKSISHSHRATSRAFKPNLSKQKLLLGGAVRRTYVCSRCLRSGFVKKA